MLYADPPTDFEVWSPETAMDRYASNHYPVMSLGQLRAIQPPATKNCVLFLWTTVRWLAQALDLMKEWGFDY